MPRPRNYCAVDGCQSKKSNENLSFFSLPREEERRKVWLEIIGRPDLLTTKTKCGSHFVCSLHFAPAMIRNKPLLKADAVPTKLIDQPSSSYHYTNEDCQNVSTQTNEESVTIKKEPSWEQTTSDDTTQTADVLSCDAPRKREFCGAFQEPEIKRTKTQHELNTFRKDKQFDTTMVTYHHKPQPKANALPTKSLEHSSSSYHYTNEDCPNVSAVTIKKEPSLEQTSSDDSDNNPTQSENKRRKLQHDLNRSRKEIQSKESECYENFNLNCGDEVTKRFVKLLELQSKLKNKSKENRYDPEYKLFSLKLHFCSPQIYRCLKTFMNLPSESTLQRFNIVIPPKFEDRILNFLSLKLKSMPKNAKYCTLCIDEMALKRKLYYDTKRDELIGLHNINGEVTKEVAAHGCVIMLQSVVENWKQPIAYSFLASPKHYKELETWLDEVILKLFAVGIEIHAIVSEQSSIFTRYAKEIKKITPEKPYFILQQSKIYYIFDVPHLVNCIRDNLLLNDFIDEGKRISWKYIEELYAKQKQKDLMLIPKVTKKHINPNNSENGRVKYAAQIFSRSVFAAISVLVSNGSLPEEAKFTGDFIEEMNIIFDVLNSSKVSCPNRYQKAFSMNEYQIGVLEEAAVMFKKIIAIDKTTGEVKTNRLQTFINLQITIRSVMMLTEDLQEKGIKFIYTRRLNLECLQSFFRAVRQHGGNCRDPTPIQFTRAFSKLFLRNMLQNSPTSNCLEDICELLQTADSTIFGRPEPSEYNARTPSAIALNGETDYRFDLPAEDALTYVSAYLFYKCSKKHNCTNFNAMLQKIPNFDETTMFSHFKAYNKDLSFYGGLKVPPQTFIHYIEELDKVFMKNFDMIHRPGSNTYEVLKNVDFPPLCSCFPREYLLKLFTRFRIFSTIKSNNREFREGKQGIII